MKDEKAHWRVLTPKTWPDPPAEMSVSAHAEIDECPRRWALGAAEYPDIEKEHWIVDIGAAKMADTPEAFDVIVMPNLYGDILSDVAAQIAGSVGLAGSANIGTGAAMFEAIHGSAPRRAA